ncbi:histone H4 transcription factor-like [Sarcoptes scabiei]|nr:histone H4 transcription factor-like [Sarcoptes scabiei]
MEAVPRLPMLSFELKISPVCPDFANPFKRFISKYYGENGDLYDREISELENLRNSACRAARDVTGCSILKRYYCQIYSLFNRFGAFENHIGVQCVWADIYSGQTVVGDLDFELACILYNIGALHSELGSTDQRQTAEEMKISCTHFQCAVWAFQHLIDDTKLFRSSDISNDLLQFFVKILLAQAQECILEKSMLDNRKPLTVAKVTVQVVEYYKNAMSMLQQGAMNTNSQSSIIDVVGSKLFKKWKKFVEFKLTYFDSISALYLGNSSEEEKKMGERIAWFELADSKIQQAAQLSMHLDDITPSISDALTFVSDVITAKLTNAKKENDFIYHEKVPSAAQLPEIQGVPLVKGIAFNVCDPDVSGQDIFARLVPIEAHEIASIYSAQQDEILREIRGKIEDKNQELISYLSSLQLEKEFLRAPKEDVIPDELINICAELSLHPDSVNEVKKVLEQLDIVSQETGKIIGESKNLLEEEEKKESAHQEKFGKRPPSMIIVDLNTELNKHDETHKKAVVSNVSLWENFDQHKDDIIVMNSSSASKIAAILPSNKNIKIDEATVSEMERLFDKIEEMKKQRIMLEEQLTKEMDQDNILKFVLAHPKEEIKQIFEQEIKKYDKIVDLIEKNLAAQKNILNALTNCNADYASTRKEIIEIQRNRKTRIASLLYTYQVFQELKVNSKKGLEFYQKFQSIVTRLNARIRGVIKVQDEERAQFSQTQAARSMFSAGQISNNFGFNFNPNSVPLNGTTCSPKPSETIVPNIPLVGAKLKDYLPFMKPNANQSLNKNLSQQMISNPTTAFVPNSGPTSSISGNFPTANDSINQSQTLPNRHPNQPFGSNGGLPATSYQYSPPPSYSQALSNNVTYPLPAMLPTTDFSAPMNSNASSTHNFSSGLNENVPIVKPSDSTVYHNNQLPTNRQSLPPTVPMNNIYNPSQLPFHNSSVSSNLAMNNSSIRGQGVMNFNSYGNQALREKVISNNTGLIQPHMQYNTAYSSPMSQNQNYNLPSNDPRRQTDSASAFVSPTSVQQPMPTNLMLQSNPSLALNNYPHQYVMANDSIKTTHFQTINDESRKFFSPSNHSQQIGMPHQNQANNITVILEQESKLGWSVLQPTPVSTVIDSNESQENSKNANDDGRTKIPSVTNPSNEEAIPDILSTMLSINGNENDSQQKNSTDKAIDSKCSPKSSSESGYKEADPSAPKDLLLQFDPLFG